MYTVYMIIISIDMPKIVVIAGTYTWPFQYGSLPLGKSSEKQRTTAQGIFSYGISVIRMDDYSSLELISCTTGEKSWLVCSMCIDKPSSIIHPTNWGGVHGDVCSFERDCGASDVFRPEKCTFEYGQFIFRFKMRRHTWTWLKGLAGVRTPFSTMIIKVSWGFRSC